jgi:transposase-like protein
MVTISIPCPYCPQTEPVIKHGVTAAGSQRLEGKACDKTFTPHPIVRTVTPQKEAQILAHFEERTSIRGIAFAASVASWDAVPTRSMPS